MKVKQLVLRMVVAAEVAIFSYFYVYGIGGFHVIRELQEKNNDIRQEIACLENEIVGITKDIQLWQDDSFYREKLAREQLHMACPSDQVYYIVSPSSTDIK